MNSLGLQHNESEAYAGLHSPLYFVSWKQPKDPQCQVKLTFSEGDFTIETNTSFLWWFELLHFFSVFNCLVLSCERIWGVYDLGNAWRTKQSISVAGSLFLILSDSSSPALKVSSAFTERWMSYSCIAFETELQPDIPPSCIRIFKAKILSPLNSMPSDN